MQPGGLSSLIFVVIIGVWAAYFIQYWVRRREHLATAQSVDQFSESLRVLERRNPQPVSAAAGSAAPATSAHAAYGQLLVRRAAEARLQSPDAPVESSHTRQGDPTRPPAVPAGRRTRGLVMLGALSTAVVAVPLVVLSLLPTWALVVPVVSIVASFAWVRASARAEQRARRAARQHQRHAVAQPVGRIAEPARRPVRPSMPASEGPVAPAAESAQRDAQRDAQPAAQPGGAPVDAEARELVDEPAAPAARRAEPYDVQAVEAAHAPAPRAAAVVEDVVVPALPLVDEDDIPLTWDPVPVPRPTYAMKSRVTRPAPTSADLVGDADTEYAPVEDELPVRRAAGA